MSRRRIGAHGKPLMWTDNRVRMTIRPEPSILDDEDLAMLLGYRLDIQDTEEMTEARAIKMIWDYEIHNKLTQKHALELVSDSWYLENYNMGSDTHEIFDKNEEHHRVLLKLVHRIWPQFKNTGEE